MFGFAQSNFLRLISGFVDPYSSERTASQIAVARLALREILVGNPALGEDALLAALPEDRDALALQLVG